MPAETPVVGAREAINRGFNMLAAAVLGISGLAFGSLVFEEMDPTDKIDNSLLVLVAIVAVVWYFWGNNRYRESTTPLVLAGVAVAVQLSAWGIEWGDSVALGDDIGGTLVYIPLLIVLVLVFRANRELRVSA